jgi:hypothetical protein
MENLHILDTLDKLKYILDLSKKNKGHPNDAESLIRDPAITYLIMRSRLKLPYEVKLNYLYSFARYDLVLPTQVFYEHQNGNPIGRYGDIFIGFEIRSREPIKLITVTQKDQVLWEREFADVFYVSFDESLDGLTIPIISFLFTPFRLSIFGHNGLVSDVSIHTYYSFMDTAERRVVASLPATYPRDQNKTFEEAFCAEFDHAKKMRLQIR